jgi:DNA-binding NarL/FixJ family response regulator
VGGARARGIRLVHDGEDYAVLELTPSVGDAEVTTASPPTGAISPAERAVLVLLIRGLSNGEIAAERGTSVRTVANQLQKLYRKFHVTSRVELVAKLGPRVVPVSGEQPTFHPKTRGTDEPRGA